MRIINKKREKQLNKKTFAAVLSALVLLLLVTLAFIFFYLPNRQTTFTGDGNQTEYNNDKKDSVNDNDGSSNDKGADSSDGYIAPTSSSGISLTFETSDNTVIVHTALEGYSDGTCTLTITNGQHTYTNTAEVIFAPDYSICAGFTVPTEGLGNGMWQISLDVLSGNETTNKKINYEVSQ